MAWRPKLLAPRAGRQIGLEEALIWLAATLDVCICVGQDEIELVQVGPARVTCNDNIAPATCAYTELELAWRAMSNWGAQWRHSAY